jgi:hypothetical protein
MSQGLNVYNRSGGLLYSTADVTWNQVDFFLVDGYSSSSRNYSVISGKEVLVTQCFVNPPPLDRKAIAHTIVVSGTNVTVNGGSESAYIMVLMR